MKAVLYKEVGVKSVLSESQLRFFKKAAECTVFLTANRDNTFNMGTGAIISPDGHILTALHVVEGRKVTVRVCRCRLDARGLCIRTYGKYLANLIDKDRASDIALLKLRQIPSDGLHPVVLGNSNELKMGQPLFRIGYDFDERNLGLGHIYRFGTSEHIPEFRVSMNNDCGASGGPIFDRHRRLLGIVLRGERSEFLPPFASVIPINEIKRRLLQKHGLCRSGAKVSGPWKKRHN